MFSIQATGKPNPGLYIGQCDKVWLFNVLGVTMMEPVHIHTHQALNVDRAGAGPPQDEDL